MDKKEVRQSSEVRNYFLDSILDPRLIEKMDQETVGLPTQERCLQCIYHAVLKDSEKDCCKLNLTQDPPAELFDGQCFCFFKNSDELFSLLLTKVQELLKNCSFHSFEGIWNSGGSKIASIVSNFCRNDIVTAFYVSEVNFYINHDIADNRIITSVFRIENAHSVLTRVSYYDGVWKERQNCPEAEMLKVYAELLGKMMNRI